MARSRNIKPGLYKNDYLAECSIAARYLFPGLWMLADREGRLEDRPRRIKAEIYPYDNLDVDALLDELWQRKFINRYEISGEYYIEIVNFKKHQNPHCKESESEIPAPKSFNEYENNARIILAPYKHGASTVQEQVKHNIEKACSKNKIDDETLTECNSLIDAKNKDGNAVINDPNHESNESSLSNVINKLQNSTIQEQEKHHTSTVLVQCKNSTSPADSLLLIPDSLLLIPDSIDSTEQKKDCSVQSENKKQYVISSEDKENDKKSEKEIDVVVIELPINTGELIKITEDQLRTWESLYQATDVMTQLRKMRGWLDANPKKRKTKRGINNFIVSWLSREQDKNSNEIIRFHNQRDNGNDRKPKGISEEEWWSTDF